MAIKATVFKAELNVSDLDRHYYASHALTLARHPSETDERMMVRLLAFALHAHEALAFTRGLSTEDEPDLWRKALSGEVEQWIELGQPDEKRLRRACGRAAEVFVYCYSGNSAAIWWQQQQDKLARFDNLNVINLAAADCQALAGLTQRTMQLHCTIQDGQVWFGDDQHNLEVGKDIWQHSEAAPG